MKIQDEILAVVAVLIFISSGCVRAISNDLRAQVEEEISIRQVIKNPAAFQGQMVIWGGVIVKAENLKKGTFLEILQKPISSEERPRNVDQSEGRFLALYEGYLDVAIYSMGREISSGRPPERAIGKASWRDRIYLPRGFCRRSVPVASQK